jgi:hypothetical protein
MIENTLLLRNEPDGRSITVLRKGKNRGNVLKKPNIRFCICCFDDSFSRFCQVRWMAVFERGEVQI